MCVKMSAGVKGKWLKLYTGDALSHPEVDHPPEPSSQDLPPREQPLQEEGSGAFLGDREVEREGCQGIQGHRPSYHFNPECINNGR